VPPSGQPGLPNPSAMPSLADFKSGKKTKLILPDNSDPKIMKMKVNSLQFKERPIPDDDQKELFNERHQERMARSKQDFDEDAEEPTLLFMKTPRATELQIKEVQFEDLIMESFSSDEDEPSSKSLPLNHKEKIILVPLKQTDLDEKARQHLEDERLFQNMISSIKKAD
jgi:hypothetical protein